jgi:regulator of sigma E protease
MSYLLAILGLALLMVVHEGGHFLAARRHGMRVTRFSIGFGPRLLEHQPKGSETTYQIALIPFLAYVQIDGMNPFDEIDPNDKGSYANASLPARVEAIAMGPLANYAFASVLLFFGFFLGGRDIIDDKSMRVTVMPHGAAEAAGLVTGDKILEVAGKAVQSWDDLRSTIGAHPGEAVAVAYEREGQRREVQVTPGAKGSDSEGKIRIMPSIRHESVGLGESLGLALTEPTRVVYMQIRGLVRTLTGKEKAEFSGPVGIAKEVAGAVRSGVGDALKTLAILSAYLGWFNLLPFPSLDGGRLIFLGIEALSRRKPDAKMEARIHAFGLMIMLALVAFVSWGDLFKK